MQAPSSPYLSCLLPRQLWSGPRSGACWEAVTEAAGACRVRAGPARVQELPQSDFPTVELQPRPCPGLKNFLNSIPALLLPALKLYSVCTSIRLCQANAELLGCLQLSMGNMCPARPSSPATAPMASAGLTTTRGTLLERVRVSQPFSTQALLGGVRCWRHLLFLLLNIAPVGLASSIHLF